MRNTLFILFLLVLVSCSTGKVVKPTKPVSSRTPMAESVGKTADLVTIKKFTNFRESEKKKIFKAKDALNKMVMGDCFEKFMLKQDLRKTNGLTNKQVVDHIRSSHTDIELIMYYKRWSKVHGYTYPNVKKIWFNRKYHSGTTYKDEASNFFHELLHKYGYGHAYKAHRDRPLSVPYTGNKVVKECIK